MLKSTTRKTTRKTNLVVEHDQSIEIIPWREFQKAIAPMWDVAKPSSIPIINNPYRVIRLPQESWPETILHYPIRFSEEGVVKGYTCVYNVSQTAVRIRGIYILPEHRGQGAGMRMTKAAMSLFPKGFHRMVGFFKETTAEKFIDHCDFKPVPNADWLWSEYQKIRLRALYWDRSAPVRGAAKSNAAFVASQIATHGFGGTNNLNDNWDAEEWLEFSEPHATAYFDANINVDF